MDKPIKPELQTNSRPMLLNPTNQSKPNTTIYNSCNILGCNKILDQAANLRSAEVTTTQFWADEEKNNNNNNTNVK